MLLLALIAQSHCKRRWKERKRRKKKWREREREEFLSLPDKTISFRLTLGPPRSLSPSLSQSISLCLSVGFSHTVSHRHSLSLSLPNSLCSSRLSAGLELRHTSPFPSHPPNTFHLPSISSHTERERGRGNGWDI